MNLKAIQSRFMNYVQCKHKLLNVTEKQHSQTVLTYCIFRVSVGEKLYCVATDNRWRDWDSLIKGIVHPKMYSPSSYSRCRWVCFFSGTNFDKFSIISLAHDESSFIWGGVCAFWACILSRSMKLKCLKHVFVYYKHAAFHVTRH